MITTKEARTFALSFEEVTEEPHFSRTSFRIRKRIFATLDEAQNQMIVKLTPVQQVAFGGYNPAAIYPVPGNWGKQGYTVLELTKVRKDMFRDAVTTSYCNTAPKKLGNKYRLIEE